MTESEQAVERRRRVESLPLWIHTIDLGDGLATPGLWPKESQVNIASALDTIDFTGRKVLDIGCLDGLWSFDAERRGAAEVIATDLTTQVRPDPEPYFRLAQELLGSGVTYRPDVSVLEVPTLGIRDFDIVLYLGVYYHLRDPLLAFARLRQVMREDAILVVEGQALDDPEPYAHFFYRDRFQGDPSNWWVPSLPCLRQWIESSFFDVVEEAWHPQRDIPEFPHTGRCIMQARAVRRADPLIAFRDPELDPYDLNEY